MFNIFTTTNNFIMNILFSLLLVVQLFFSSGNVLNTPNNGDEDAKTEKIEVKGAMQNANFSIISKDGTFMRVGTLIGNEIHIAKLKPGVYYIKTMTEFRQPQSFAIVK